MQRHKFLLAPILAIFCLLLTRLAHLQIVSGMEYRQLADNNRFLKQVIPAERGAILDRYQQPLVNNKKQYYLRTQKGRDVSRELISTDEALQAMAGQDDQAVEYELRRRYLYPKQLAHVIGYTAPATKEDLLGNRQLKVNDWVGKIGLEQQFDQFLRGQDGHQLYEVNTLGERQRLLSDQPAKPGQDIETSLDPYLSRLAFESLGQMTGAAVVLDADTGRVLTMVSKPSFNANDLSAVALDLQQEQQRQLNLQSYFQDERQVFFSRASQATYPPGSVFKMVTALAGLQQDAFDEHKTVLDEGILRVGDYEYANWLYTQRGATDGEIALVRAIARSNDIYFYKAAEWTGPNNIAQQARDFGFGQPTGIEVANEAAGLVPDPAWKEETFGERWFLGNTYHFGIGQSDLLASPLQVAQMVQALVKGGELCAPRLLTESAVTAVQNGRAANSCSGLGLTEENIDLVLKGMIAACQPGGTGSLLFDFNQGFIEANQAESGLDLLNQGAVACKTGTSEFGPENEQGRRKTHAWFVAGTTVDQDIMIERIQSRAEQLNENRQDQEEQTAEVNQVLTKQELEQWAEAVAEHGFPKKVAVVVVVESDDRVLFKEGSIHAAPIVVDLLEWMK